ncbi:MAG: DinB family protein [Pelolinea sp.]|nr:DinB family protein [Pelolinea sp.]
MVLNIVNQLKFTRFEFKKGFSDVSEEDANRRFLPINTIGWIVGHLAWHEQFYWLKRAQDKVLIPELIDLVGYGKPASTPSLVKMIDYWEQITRASDSYLDQLTESDLLIHLEVKGKNLNFNVGTMITRVIYHYWYHNGELQAQRQLLGHKNLPDAVSDEIETIGKYYLD